MSSTTVEGTGSPGNALEAALHSGAVPTRVSGGAPLQREGSWYVMPGRKADALVARDPRKGMQFQLYAQHRVLGTATATPLNLSRSASAAIPVTDDRGLFFANTYPSTDAAVFPGPAGPDVTLQLRGPQAPSEFSWRIAGTPGRLVGDARSQTVALNYHFHTPEVSGSIDLLYVQAGLAFDSSGFPVESTDPSARPTRVPTHVSLSGDRATVRIDRPAGLRYPLLLDVGWHNDP